MSEEIQKPTPFARHPRTEALIAFLRDVKEEESVSYAELSEVAGGNVQGETRNRLDSARNYLSREGVEFLTVVGEGLRRALPGQLVAESAGNVKRVGRQARKFRRRLLNGEYDRLTKEERATQARHGFALTLQAGLARKPTLQRLGASIDDAAERRRFTQQEAIRRLVEKT